MLIRFLSRRLSKSARLPLISFAIALAVLAPDTHSADEPEWWIEQKAVDPDSEPLDYAAANQGQLKNMAVGAYEHFLATIPSELGGMGNSTGPNGVGWRLRKLVSQWVVIDYNFETNVGTGKVFRRRLDANGNPVEPPAEPYSIDGTGPRQLVPPPPGGTNDFSAINLGQLKATAKPFYDRLQEIRALDTASTWTDPTWAHPWTVDGGTAENFAAVNLGQLKRVFSFDVRHDLDGDEASNIEEMLWNLNHPLLPPLKVGGANAGDADGDGVLDGVELANGTNPTVGDTDGDGVSDRIDGAPTDPNRASVVPARSYATIKAEHLPGVSPQVLTKATNVNISDEGGLSWHFKEKKNHASRMVRRHGDAKHLARRRHVDAAR